MFTKLDITFSIFVLFFLTFLSCNKDQETIHIEKESNSLIHTPTGNLSLIDVQNYFEKSFSNKRNLKTILSSVSNDDNELCTQINPLWYMASNIQTLEGKSLMIVPLDILGEEIIDGRGMQMTFYINELNEMESEIVLYEASGYDNTRPYSLNNNYFSGFINVINTNTRESRLFPIENGEILGLIEVEPNIDSGSRYDPKLLSWLCRWFGIGCGCNRAGGVQPGSGWKDLIKKIKRHLKNLSAGGGGPVVKPWSTGSYGFPTYSPSGPNGGGGNYVHPKINTLFDGTFFHGEGTKVVQTLDKICVDYNIRICNEELFTRLYQCISDTHEPINIPHGGLPTNPPNELSIDDFIRYIKGVPLDPCIENMISEYSSTEGQMETGDAELICVIEKHNEFDIDDTELFNEIKTECGTSKECQQDLFSCLGKLQEFQDKYGVTLNSDLLDQLVFDAEIPVCEQGFFEDKVKDAIVHRIFTKFGITDQETKDWVNDNSDVWNMLLTNFSDTQVDEIIGTPIKLLKCNSFRWTQVGQGWISCLDPNILDIELGSTGSSLPLDLGCLSFTVPKTRKENGKIVQEISDDEASSCAALASNVATIAVKSAIAMTPSSKLNSIISKWFFAKIFKEAFDAAMTNTNCGYGSIASCNESNCPEGSDVPNYSDDFVEVTKESLYGGCH